LGSGDRSVAHAFFGSIGRAVSRSVGCHDVRLQWFVLELAYRKPYTCKSR
jgi:hypothetical protein